MLAAAYIRSCDLLLLCVNLHYELVFTNELSPQLVFSIFRERDNLEAICRDLIGQWRLPSERKA